MSRSKRKNPIAGFAKSNRMGKRIANRKYRKHINQNIQQGVYEFKNIRTLSNVWNMSKDVKLYWGNDLTNKLVTKLLRK